MMNKLNILPKEIDLIPYLKDLQINPDDILLTVEEKLKGFLLINTTRDNQFRISYAVYGYEGIECYFPFNDEQLLELSQYDFLSNQFSGGFIGNDIDKLSEDLYNWCKQFNYL